MIIGKRSCRDFKASISSSPAEDRASAQPAVLRLTEGASMTAGDINEARLDTTREAAGASGDKRRRMRFDLGDESSIIHLVKQAMHGVGSLDGVANVAADVSPTPMGRDDEVDKRDRALRTQLLQVNLIGNRGIDLHRQTHHCISQPLCATQ